MLTSESINFLALIDLISEPVFIVDRSWKVVHHNAAAKRVLASTKSVIRLHKGYLNLWNAHPNAPARRWSLAAGENQLKIIAGGGMRLVEAKAAKPWLVTVSPLKRAEKIPDHYVVHMVRRIRPRKLPVALLEDMFGLTAKEILVLQRLVGDETLKTVSVSLNLSHETVRSYVKRIFRKCEVHSQADLCALIGRITLFGAGLRDGQ